MKKLVPILMAIAMLFSFALPVSAAEYTYTVRIYAGAQGNISGENVIIRTGLRYGDRVNFNIDSVELNNDSKYYVKGIRESGKDNNTVSANSIFVTGDMDYVVAYGLKGSSVAYTVHYVDTEGNELYPVTTYYGNVGDKPVVSYQYVEGYQPQAYNVTRTLREDPTENVFTFTYTRLEGASSTPGGENNPGGNPGGETNPGGEDIPAQVIPNAGPNNPGGNAGENEGGNGGGNGDRPTEEIDDQDPPLANNPIEEITKVFADASALPLEIKLTICGGTLMLLALVGWLLLFGKRKKREDEDGDKA